MIYQPFGFNGAHNANAFVRFSGDGAALARVINATIRDVAPQLNFWAAPQTIQFASEVGTPVSLASYEPTFLCAAS